MPRKSSVCTGLPRRVDGGAGLLIGILSLTIIVGGGWMFYGFMMGDQISDQARQK